LLGTYFVFISIFCLIHYKYQKKAKITFESFVGLPANAMLCSFLTLSTGAFVSQLTAYIPSKFYKLKKIVFLSILLIMFGLGCYFITKYVSPDLHHKIFGSINYFKETSIGNFYQDSIHQNLELNDSENSGSFTWRIYSYTFYIHNIFSQKIINFLFGSGVESFLLFASFAPHNDFIAIFLDFGLFGLLCFVFFLSKLFKIAVKINFNILATFIVFLVLRLLFENVIYSSYVFSLITSIGGLLYGSVLPEKNVIKK
jgi:hypothetical protein